MFYIDKIRYHFRCYNYKVVGSSQVTFHKIKGYHSQLMVLKQIHCFGFITTIFEENASAIKNFDFDFQNNVNRQKMRKIVGTHIGTVHE